MSPSWVSLVGSGGTHKTVEPETESLPDVSGFNTENISNKLSDEDVREIRNRYPGDNGPTLANEFDVSKRTIYNVVDRKTHKHIG
jgi:hypothetical protein